MPSTSDCAGPNARSSSAGALTGKDLKIGGSHAGPQATGCGAVDFLQTMLAECGHTLEDKTTVVSDSGNVAQYALRPAVRGVGERVRRADGGSGDRVTSASCAPPA
ncbi:hypothetical protein [Streptomyces sp. NPDC094472]|uniref:hypothetical protein n=1 Tax=Streptomyces sp. NPDC094472 TaxID=3155080 RepID=UPI00332B9318